MRHTLSLLLLVAFSAFFSACSSIDLPDNPTAEQRFRAGMAEFEDGDYFDALQHFDVIRLQFPGSAISDSARYYSGLSRFRREEYLLASYEFSQLIQNNPSSRLLADAQYMFADCYVQMSPRPALDQSYTIRAIDALQTYIELYPRHARVPDAERLILELTERLAQKEYETGILYLKLDNTRSALVYFNTVIDRYYNTGVADDALAMKIRVIHGKKGFEQSAPLIRTFLEKYPSSEYREEIQRYRDEQAPQSTSIPR